MLVLMLIRVLVLMTPILGLTLTLLLVVMVMADTAGVGSDDDPGGDTDGDTMMGLMFFVWERPTLQCVAARPRRTLVVRGGLHRERHARRAGRIAPCPASPRTQEGSRLN